MSVTARQLPLKGIRVVDFSWVMAGPIATKMLGTMGAEVIKVESATRPEYTNRAGMFRVINNNKLSCSINIARPEGQELVRRLVGVSDVVVENFSARVLSKYGLGYEDLRVLRPDIVFVSASGVGRTGPQRDALAYGTLLQAYSGRAGMIGAVNARLEAMGIQPAWTDPMTALWEALAILAALIHRRRTSLGAYVDLSMLESTVALLPEALLRQQLGVSDVPPGGNREIGAAPAGCFRCAGEDEWLALAVRSDRQWQDLCATIGRRELAHDARYADAALRERHKRALDEMVADWLRQRSADQAEAALQASFIPAARARNYAELIEDPHVCARGLFPIVADGRRTVALPWMDETGWRGSYALPPSLGGDNDYVLGRLLGLDRAEIDRLVRDGVIQ
jgi:benzylsuccinate CoA-transferase BbsF subunit